MAEKSLAIGKSRGLVSGAGGRGRGSLGALRMTGPRPRGPGSMRQWMRPGVAGKLGVQEQDSGGQELILEQQSEADRDLGRPPEAEALSHLGSRAET